MPSRHERDGHLVPRAARRPPGATAISTRPASQRCAIAARTTIVLVSRPEQGAIAEAARTRAELAATGHHAQPLVSTPSSRRPRRDPLRRLGAAGRARCRHSEGEWATASSTCRSREGADGRPGASRRRSLRAADGRPSGARDRYRRTPADPLAALVRDLAVPARGVILTMGKGGVGQDDRRRGGGDGVRPAGTPGAPQHHRSRRAPAATLARRAGPDGRAASIRRGRRGLLRAKCSRRRRRSTPRDGRCSRKTCGHRAPRKSLSSAPSRARRGGRGRLRRPRHGAHRPHAAAAGRRRGVSPRGRAHAERVPDEVRARCCRGCATPRTPIVLLVTLPEATPVHEAAQLQDDLRRAGIPRWAGSSISASRRRPPIRYSARVRAREAVHQRSQPELRRIASVCCPWQAEPPVGFPARAAGPRRRAPADVRYEITPPCQRQPPPRSTPQPPGEPAKAPQPVRTVPESLGGPLHGGRACCWCAVPGAIAWAARPGVRRREARSTSRSRC